MIGFFKNIFKPKEELVKFSEINKWLDNNNKELPELKEKFREVEHLKNEISENLKVLGCVDLSHAKVEDRVRRIVQGNLPAYINALSLFLKKVNLPEGIDAVSLETFCQSFDKEFEDLNKRTFRNFQIIKELVGKELEDVAKSVKQLELLVKEIKNHAYKIKGIAEIKEKAGFIRDSFENKGRNLKIREGLKKKEEELIALIEKLNGEIEGLKASKWVKDLEILSSEEKKVFGSLIELEGRMICLFSPLQKALKKYNNMCFIKKVNNYVERPVNALLNDRDFEILKFLKDIRSMIEEDKIGLKEDKKKKATESLDSLDENFLKEFVKEHALLKKKLDSIKEEIKANTVLKEIEELKREINASNSKIEDIRREMNKIKDVNIEDELGKLEKRLNEVFSCKVKIENVMG